MIHIAYRNLLQNKFRFFLSLGGVALAMMLIVFLRGFQTGVFIQVTSYLDHAQVDWVISQKNVTTFLGATSLLPTETEALAQGVPGIEQVIPITAQYTILDIHEQKVVGFLVGYEPDRGGGPWAMLAGRPLRRDDEVVLDGVLAQDHGLHLGDTVEILGKDFSIVGLSSQTNSWMAGLIFIKKEAAEDLLLSPGASSFLLLRMKAGADPVYTMQRLHRRLGDDIEVLASSAVKQNDRNLLVKIFAVPLQLMVVIAFAVGTVILGMIIYTATVSRAQEYGVLKAVGTHNHDLYGLVVQQALFIAVLGVGAGIGLAQIAANGVMSVYPKFLIVLEFAQVLPAVLVGLAMGLLAAILPARYLSMLDPAQVFRK